MKFGFYKRRLQAVCGWGNTHSSINWRPVKCGCRTDHYFSAPTKDELEHLGPRTVVIRPCLKHTGKFFKTKWK